MPNPILYWQWRRTEDAPVAAQDGGWSQAWWSELHPSAVAPHCSEVYQVFSVTAVLTEAVGASADKPSIALEIVVLV